MGFGGTGSYHDAQSPASFLSTAASDHYANPGEGFTGREISREARPEVPRYMTHAPFRSPQHKINFDDIQRRRMGLPPATDEEIQALLDAPPFNPVSEVTTYD